jgi:flagellin
MRINNNLQAMNTHRQMGVTENAQAKSMEKLSSGYRINRAGDDAAGLSISEKMRSQIKGLNQASRNSQDAISLVQTAEGALNETQSILQRMRELSVQSSNDTNVVADRDAIQNEVDQLTAEIDRIGNTTEFNTRKLLNGGAGITGTTTNTDISVVGGTADTTVVTGATLTMAAATTSSAAATTVAIAATSKGDFTINGNTFTLAGGGTATENGDEFAAFINDNTDTIGVTAVNTGGSVELTSTSVGASSNISLTSASGDLSGTVAPAAVAVDADGSNASAGALTGSAATDATASSAGNIVTISGGEYDGLQVKITENGAATLSVTANGSLSMQIGANEGQDMNVSLNDMRASALGVSAIDVSDTANATAAITTINNAITSVSSERGKLGSIQNRLEHTISNLDTSAENLQAAESRIRDVDMAKEMMEFTKNNILQQAAQSMLAQANQAPQGVLQLLR